MQFTNDFYDQDVERAMMFSLMSAEQVEKEMKRFDDEKFAGEIADMELAQRIDQEMNGEMKLAQRVDDGGEMDHDVEEKLVREVQERSFDEDKPRQNPIAASDAKFIVVDYDGEDVCTICQDSMKGCQVAYLSCDHSFHRECLLRSFDFDDRCGNCQTVVTQGVVLMGSWGLMDAVKFRQLVQEYSHVCRLLLVDAQRILADQKVAVDVWADFVEKKIVTSYHEKHIYIWAKTERCCERKARAAADILRKAGINSSDRVEARTEIDFCGKLADLRTKALTDVDSSKRSMRRPRSSRSLSP